MLSISNKLKRKKYVKPKRIVTGVYHLIANVLTKPYNIKVNIIDDVKKEKGPCFIIFNHVSRMDHLYVERCVYPKPYVNVAGYNEFFRKKFKLVFGLCNIIPKKNYTPDVSTIKGMRSMIKSGGSVVFSPEGLASNFGCNKPIVPETSKVFKHFNIPVYLCKIEGTYLQQTKLCLDEKYGETHVTMTKLFTPEQTQSLSVQEMDDIVNEALRTNAYEWNREKMIKWSNTDNMFLNYEWFLYKCPKCHKEFTMIGKGHDLYCTECGNGTTMDEYYIFHPYKDSIIPTDPVEWVVNERKDLIDEIRADKNYSFSDTVEIGNLKDDEYIKTSMDTTFKVGKGTFTVDHTGVHFEGTRNGEPYRFDAPYTEVYTTITFNDAKYFSFYVHGELFDIFPENKTTGKFILLIEEMHRLHVNTYKNFKWFDYLYEGKELGIDKK